MENLNSGNDERIDQLEKQLTEAKWIAEEADKKYEEVICMTFWGDLSFKRHMSQIDLAVLFSTVFFFIINPDFAVTSLALVKKKKKSFTYGKENKFYFLSDY